MGLAEAAKYLGVSEADVMASITAGDMKAKKIGVPVSHHESSDRHVPGPVNSVTALGKRPCPDCGGEMEWNAAKQVIACPYCGFVPKEQPSKNAPDDASILEHDLEKALGEAGAEKRGYGAETVKVKCQSCQAISVFESARVAQRCEFCGSPAIVPYQETRDAITPESLLPVKLDEPRVRDIVKRWVASAGSRPTALSPARSPIL